MRNISRNKGRRQTVLTFRVPHHSKCLSILSFIALFVNLSRGESIFNEKPGYHVGVEGNSSVYRWANGYREQLIPTFNTTREARRSVVSGGLFSIVSFDNVPCISDPTGEIGTCYSPRECTNLNGVNSGICAGNYGTCCVITATCGGTITTNNTYFVNPDYPGTTNGPLSCTVTVSNLDGASELYMEMIEFNIRGPSSGACLNDTFTVTTDGGTTQTIPVICGNNTGQFLYLPLGATTSTLTFNLAGGIDGRALLSGNTGRSWKIRLVQFKKTDACAAPDGCTQYYRDPVGVFESFNFGGGMGEYINNFCINACFKVNNPPNCGVILSEGTFMLPGMAPNDCTEGDFLQIGGNMFCGDTLNNGMIVVNSTVGGFAQVRVCSGMDNPDMDVGFSLNYSPFPCNVAG